MTHSSRNRMTLVFFTLALTVACDPQKTAQDGATASKSRAPAAVADKAHADTPAPAGEPASLSECLSSCDGGDMIPTNRATCRLNCETAHGGAPRAAAVARTDDAIGRAAECMSRCQGEAGTAGACASACKTTAATAATAEVLDQLGTCVDTCHADKDVRPTDRATCELNCAQVARVSATPPPSSAPAGT